MVSKASEDLPEPDRPVITTRLSRGISTSMFFRLCSRAPRTESVLPAILSLMNPGGRGDGTETDGPRDIVAAVGKIDSETALAATRVSVGRRTVRRKVERRCRAVPSTHQPRLQGRIEVAARDHGGDLQALEALAIRHHGRDAGRTRRLGQNARRP